MLKKIFLLTTFSFVLWLSSCGQQPYMGCCDVVEEHYVHRYGVPVDPNDWNERGQNGVVISTLKNGVIVSKNFHQGVLDGDTTYTFPHNQTIERIGTYSNGTLAKETIHNVTGAPKVEIQYPGNQQKIITKWSERGYPECREQYEGSKLVQGDYYNKDHQLESQVIQGLGVKPIRDNYGNVVGKENYANGSLVLQTSFHPTGAPKEQQSYANGVPHGTKKTFSPDGEPESMQTWQAGAQNGITTLYQNGEKYAEVPYVNGVKQGVEKRYREGKILVQEVTWVNGYQQGPVHTYFGERKVTDWYYQDRQVTKDQYELLMNPPHGYRVG